MCEVSNSCENGIRGTLKITCSKCGLFLEPERIGLYSYCRACHAEYMRQNRRKHSELTPEQRKKANARSYAKEYLKRGKLVKQPCEVCQSENSQMHHDDYDKPLEVRWLCRKHHLDHHKNAA